MQKRLLPFWSGFLAVLRSYERAEICGLRGRCLKICSCRFLIAFSFNENTKCNSKRNGFSTEKSLR
jgi:hypothetical protein